MTDFHVQLVVQLSHDLLVGTQHTRDMAVGGVLLGLVALAPGKAESLLHVHHPPRPGLPPSGPLAVRLSAAPTSYGASWQQEQRGSRDLAMVSSEGT